MVGPGASLSDGQESRSWSIEGSWISTNYFLEEYRRSKSAALTPQQCASSRNLCCSIPHPLNPQFLLPPATMASALFFLDLKGKVWSTPGERICDMMD
jgi:hypothetical protein